MPLRALYDSADQIPAALREFYVEQKDGPAKGRFALAVESAGGFAFEHVDGLRGALETERAERRKLKELAKEFEGLDPKVAREALTKVEQMSSWTPDDKVRERIEAAVRAVKDDGEKKVSKATAALAAKEAAIRKLLVHGEAAKAAAKHKGDLTLLLPLIERVATVMERDGQDLPELVLEEQKGVPLMTRQTGFTGNMSVDEYFGILKERHPRAFDGPDSSGSGATGAHRGNGAGGAGATIRASQLNDPVAYRAAKEAAVKAGQSTPQVIPG